MRGDSRGGETCVCAKPAKPRARVLRSRASADVPPAKKAQQVRAIKSGVMRARCGAFERRSFLRHFVDVAPCRHIHQTSRACAPQRRRPVAARMRTRVGA